MKIDLTQAEINAIINILDVMQEIHDDPEDAEMVGLTGEDFLSGAQKLFKKYKV